MQFIHSLDQLPKGLKIGIYGTGKLASLIHYVLQKNRRDIEVVCFVDKENLNPSNGVRFVKLNEMDRVINQVNCFLVASNNPYITRLNIEHMLFIPHPYLLTNSIFNDLAESFNMLGLVPPLIISQDAVTYNNDGLMLIAKNLGFMRDPLFIESYKKAKETLSWESTSELHYRVYVCCWAASRVKDLEGDFVECGVNKGGLSSAVINYVGFDKLLDKRFYLFDTYQGLSKAHLSSDKEIFEYESKWKDYYTDCYDEVKERFSKYENVSVIKGTVPETLENVTIDKVSYLSIDMNCYLPEIKAMEFFWPKMVKGGIIILDDYAWVGHEDQQKGFDIFAKEHNIQILTLPTGQGLIIK